MKKALTLVLGLCLCFAIGCSQNPKPVTGAANQFDSDSYLALDTTDNVIQSTKSALAANSFPAAIAGGVKTALNDLITAYDIANATYRAYHAAALAGVDTVQQRDNVTATLNTVGQKTTVLVTAKGGN
jgi:hypothetical protein